MTTKLHVYQGDTATYEVTVTTSKGEVVNLTDASIVFSVVQYLGDTTYLIQKSSEDISELEITDPTNGRFKVYLNSTDLALAPGYYAYDIEITLASGQRQTIEQDFLIVKQDVS